MHCTTMRLSPHSYFMNSRDHKTLACKQLQLTESVGKKYQNKQLWGRHNKHGCSWYLGGLTSNLFYSGLSFYISHLQTP
jgi:hypothetical protein